MRRLSEEGTPSSSAWRRATQYLAIPLGGLAPAHRRIALPARLWRRYDSALLTAAGLIAAAAAVFVALLPRAIPVSVDSAHLRIGSLVLDRAATSPSRGYTLYRGAAAILISDAGPHARSAGAASISGHHTAGACAPESQRTAQTIDRCTFTVESARLTSRDVFDSRTKTWQRTYSDGRAVVFEDASATASAPVPLPLGR